MLAVLVVLSVCAAASGDGDFTAECSNEDKAVTMEAAGTLPGRYVVKYCTETSPPIIKWNLWLYTMDKLPGNCTVEEKHKIHHGITHSYVEEMLDASSVNTSCSFVCFSRPMDLIFESCYRIVNQVSRHGEYKGSIIHSELDTKHLYIKNNITWSMIDKTPTFALCKDYGEKVVCTWPSLIPYTKFWVQLESNTGRHEYIQESEDYTQVVTDNCTVVEKELRCELTVPPGAYKLWLRHTAPWASGFHKLVDYWGYFNHTLPLPLEVPSTASPSAVWWSCGAVLLAALSLFVVLMLYQRRQKVKLKVQILKDWLQRQASRKSEAELIPESNPESPCVPNPVLLLYARDCLPATRAVSALKHLIRRQHGGQVLDLYEAETVARTAPAPRNTVREYMSTPHVRVVLLQTPALAALHTTRLHDSTLTLSSPLLPRHVMHRYPHPGDHMFQYALRLLQETNTTTELPYRKYFLCDLSHVPVEVFPDIVPFKRFSLPEDAPSLLQALKGPAPPSGPLAPDVPPGALDELRAASEEFGNYVVANQNYLQEMIVFLRER